MTTQPNIVDPAEWLVARQKLLVGEKELTRQGDALARQRRELPWVRVQRHYVFQTPSGPKDLTELFNGRSQLLVYHFMFGPEWEEGCLSCSFWADNFDGIDVHLQHRDVTFLAISRAPLEKLESYRARMGWSFPWVSSQETGFNEDFGVSDADFYNYAPLESAVEEAVGLSTFVLHEGKVFHTYSCFGRGVEVFNGAYQLLDMAPKGRDEDQLEWTMAWLRRHDSYDETAEP